MKTKIDPKKLYAAAPYRALNPKRRAAVAAILLEDKSFTAACEAAGLNPSRETKNQQLQYCLKWFDYQQKLPTASQDSAMHAGDLSIYEKTRRLEWLLGDQSEQPEPAVENILWKFEPEDRITYLDSVLGIHELPARPSALPADQIAAYEQHMNEIYPRDRRLCSFCGATIFGGDTVCGPCQPKRRDKIAPATPKLDVAPAVQPAPQISDVAPDTNVRRLSKCQQCGRTTPAGCLICDGCPVPDGLSSA
jgi:hypothetical protein